MSNMADIKARIAQAKAEKIAADNAAMDTQRRDAGYVPVGMARGRFDILRGIVTTNDEGRYVTGLGSIKVGSSIGEYRLFVIGESEARVIDIDTLGVYIGPEADSVDAFTLATVNGRKVSCDAHGIMWARMVNGTYRIGCQACANESAKGRGKGKKAPATVTVTYPMFPRHILDAVGEVGRSAQADYDEAVAAGIESDSELIEELASLAIAEVRAIMDAS